MSSVEQKPHSTQEVRTHAEWLMSDQNTYGVSADEELLCQMALGLVEQLEAANARKEELWTRLLEMEGKYLDTHERLVKVAEWYGHDLDAALGSNPAKRPT